MNFKEEYILCAANWYKELELKRADLPPGHIYPINVDKGIVFCAHRHLQCLYTMIAMTGKVQHEAGEEEQGFLTSKNRFVDRTEGAEIALKCGQISKLNYSQKLLYSEDLY
jgi:hypothetical protein